MYRQVLLDREDKEHHRILWQDPDSEPIDVPNDTCNLSYYFLIVSTELTSPTSC